MINRIFVAIAIPAIAGRGFGLERAKGIEPS